MRRTALAAAVVLLTTCTGPAPEPPGAKPPILPPASAGVRTVFLPHLFEENADLWPGVHLVLFGDERTLLYELRVEAGHDPERIGFAFEDG